jgi:hypothetical protein
MVMAQANQTAEPGATATFLPLRSFQLLMVTPLRTTRYLGEVATPVRPMMFLEPWLAAMAKSAGPTALTSTEFDSKAVRASA